MTHYTLADLQMADRHIEEGAQRIARQAEIVAGLEGKGFSASNAEKLLALFNDTQQANCAHREAIASALQQAEDDSRYSPIGSYRPI